MAKPSSRNLCVSLLIILLVLCWALQGEDKEVSLQPDGTCGMTLDRTLLCYYKQICYLSDPVTVFKMIKQSSLCFLEIFSLSYFMFHAKMSLTTE